MNRQIKFRAWDKEDKSWRDDVFIDMDGCVCLNECQTFFGMNGYELEIMQFTGLKDKNGVEIYEGDVLNYCGDKLPVSFGWGDDNERYSTSYGWILGSGIFGDEAVFTSEVEVIGNIYENPELLEQKKA